MADTDEWTSKASDVFTISLHTPTTSGLKPLAKFHPKFTYSIFGDEETIYGYKDLKIDLRFRATDMRPHLRVTHSKKIKSTPDVEIVDIPALLEEDGYLPKIAFTNSADFEESSAIASASPYIPPGELVESSTEGDTTYEIWKAQLSDPAAKQLVDRVQIFVPLFIEGGTYIGSEDPGQIATDNEADRARWTIFFLFRKTPTGENSDKSSYVFVGYSTIYRFFYFQPPTPPVSPKENGWELPNGDFDLANLPCRSRLSQFVILPPFQKRGNGALLYKAIFKYYLNQPQTKELTVEDPNEAFDDLRDLSDLTYLSTIPEFLQLNVNTELKIPSTGIVPKNLVAEPGVLESIRTKAKIAPRQFYRVLEIHLMSKLPDSVRPALGATKPPAHKLPKADREQHRLWQLFVKQRLYRHNRDALGQLEPQERLEKLEETLGSVEFEYGRLLAMHAGWNRHESLYHKKASASDVIGKRKLEQDSEGDEAGTTKKVRIADAMDEDSS